MSFQFPVNFDQQILRQYREDLQWASQEVEMLAINLERSPDDIATVENIHSIIQETWISSVKLDLIPISESLADTLKGLELLLDWKIYPSRMTEFILILIDRIMVIATEVEDRQFIDMRKTQAILVALQYIILAKSPDEIINGIEEAIIAISREIKDETQTQDSGDIELFDAGVDLFDDGVELFGEVEPVKAAMEPSGTEIFVPASSSNPLHEAREFIDHQAGEGCLMMLGMISDQATQHQCSHTRFVLELALAMNILAGKPLDFDSLYKGICLHDISLASLSGVVDKQGEKSGSDIDEIKLHPVKSAEVAHVMDNSQETELLVLHHHEHMDGSGYPFGLKGDNISEQGKLAAIVDSFHSSIEKYTELYDRERVLKAILEINMNIGNHYDPAWVKLFNKTIRDYWLPDWRLSLRNKIKKAG